MAGVASLNPTTVNDPLFVYQWHLMNTGQTAFATTPGTAGEDIHQTAATTQTGLGIKVAVVDTGLELAHEDLSDNIVPGASANFNTGGNDPSPATGGTNCTDHGTSVAGIISARANNGIGGRGVAGMASLVGYNFLASNQSLADFLAALGGSSYSSDVDVFNQSYGASFSSADLAGDTAFIAVESQLKAGADAGAIYVKAAGNGYSFDEGGVLDCTSAGYDCQDASFDAENTLPYNIVVTAIDGGYGPSLGARRTDYSTAGSALWISAPGGEYGIDNAFLNAHGYTSWYTTPAIVTTDLMGCSRGYSVNYFNIDWALTLNPFDMGGSPNTNCNYTASFNGTSSATPIVSGAVALMKQANSALTWRDVKHILATTAVPVDLWTGGSLTLCSAVVWDSWSPTGVGSGSHPFNRWYGFGRIDVAAAVAAATTYTPNGFGTTSAKTLVDTGFVGGAAPNLPFDCSSGASTIASNMYAPATTVAFIEAVRVRVFLTAPDLSRVAITLTNNASGRASQLLVPSTGLTTAAVGSPNNDSLDFLTNAFYGDPTSTAGFTLEVSQFQSPSLGGTLNSWQIRVYGHN